MIDLTFQFSCFPSFSSEQNQYGLIHFRAFKVDPKVEKASTVTYQGTMPGYENSFTLDHATTFLVRKSLLSFTP